MSRQAPGSEEPPVRGITIREMEEKDILQVAEIEKASIQQPWTKESFEEAAFLPHTLFLAAEENGQVLGYIGCYFSFEDAEISGIAVKKDQRRRGVGDLLLYGAERLLAEKGVKRVVLEVRRSNTGAQAFYGKNGFEKIGERKGMYDFPKEDAFVMEKREEND
jgi:ribosomal-protein-alanine N-acetyltransferase